MKIYHNPRCRKSREAVKYLEDKKIDFEIIEYLKTQITESKMKNLIGKLDINAIELVRRNEKVWKSNYKGKKMTEKKIVEILCNEPKLIERPIIETETKAVIGRPKENIDKLI